MDLFLCLQFPRSDDKSHSRTQIESHLNLALRGLEATQHQVHELVTVVKDQSQQIKRLISMDKDQLQQIEQQSKQIERLLSKDKAQSEKMGRLMFTVQDQSQQIKRLISKEEERSERMERSMSTVQDQPPQREQRGPINQIFSTPFEWQIPKLLGAQVSEPFYLFERGYKYLLKMVIAMDVLGPRLQLNTYIKVVPGEFDELLSWPCKEKVRVTLVNQEAMPWSVKKQITCD